MANMNMLKRQHEDILNVMLGIRGTVRKENLERDAANIATQISILAGKLKIHLSTEDEFMYPALLDSSNSELVNVAKEFIGEMGGISREFAEYKDRYNTKTKILNDPKGFLQETERIFKILENRIEKENKILYPLIEA
ncbi:MAG TPA: hemerythrin domain-containing protein [Clostridiaceae bacterium]|nr:hemerythrin domain-containing protein [Clostridiaceae bacterium]